MSLALVEKKQSPQQHQKRDLKAPASENGLTDAYQAERFASSYGTRDALESGSDDGTVERIRMTFSPVKLYRLRHSYSVSLLLATGNKEIVQKALGHAKISTTDIYTTMIVDPRLQDAVKRAFGT